MAEPCRGRHYRAEKIRTAVTWSDHKRPVGQCAVCGGIFSVNKDGFPAPHIDYNAPRREPESGKAEFYHEPATPAE